MTCRSDAIDGVAGLLGCRRRLLCAERHSRHACIAHTAFAFDSLKSDQQIATASSFDCDGKHDTYHAAIPYTSPLLPRPPRVSHWSGLTSRAKGSACAALYGVLISAAISPRAREIHGYICPPSHVKRTMAVSPSFANSSARHHSRCTQSKTHCLRGRGRKRLACLYRTDGVCLLIVRIGAASFALLVPPLGRVLRRCFRLDRPGACTAIHLLTDSTPVCACRGSR